MALLNRHSVMVPTKNLLRQHRQQLGNGEYQTPKWNHFMERVELLGVELLACPWDRVAVKIKGMKCFLRCLKPAVSPPRQPLLLGKG